MDPNTNQSSGVDLPQSPGGQGAVAGGVPQGQINVTLPINAADESASDEELDREWVNKAKDIVERTKSDPFAQSSELNRVKADYLKTRFNKDFNVSDGSSR